MLHAAVVMWYIEPTFFSMGNESLSWVGAVVAGLLVGFGTRLGNGCTSGHGGSTCSMCCKYVWVCVLVMLKTC
jgi:uncharacterized membrane protein YedE/YeeE